MPAGQNPGPVVLRNVIPESLRPEVTPDGVVVSGVGNAPVHLRSVWVGEGFPADVQRALVETHIDVGVDVITARRLRPGAVKVLADHGLSWADAAGYAEIQAPSAIYLSRQKPHPLPMKATTATAWSPSVSAVVEYILSRRVQEPMGMGKSWNSVDRTSHIAAATGMSGGQAARTLVMLDDEGYTTKFGPARGPSAVRELRDRSKLLSDWAGYYAKPARKELRAELHLLSRAPADWYALIASQLEGVRWATSGWGAADVVAPFATQIPDTVLYVTADQFASTLNRLVSDADVSLVERGGRIHLRSAPEYAFEFATNTRGLPVMSPIRIYGDLLRAGGRGEDAAEHLREAVIGF